MHFRPVWALRVAGMRLFSDMLIFFFQRVSPDAWGQVIQSADVWPKRRKALISRGFIRFSEYNEGCTILRMSMNTQSKLGSNGQQKSPTVARIIRAVASSTAIETGQSVKELETRLLAQNSKYQELPLATP